MGQIVPPSPIHVKVQSPSQSESDYIWREDLFLLLLFLFLFLFIYFFNQSSILYTSMYTCQSQSLNSAHHHPYPTVVSPPWCPYVCSLHLCLNFCPANRFICTIFLGSTYMH